MSTNGAIDRRARETRRRIGAAFLHLGGIRNLDKIRVGELAQTSGIARSTFYAHYQGIDDYLARSFADMLVRFAENDAGKDGCGAFLPVGSILEHVADAGQGAARLPGHRHFPTMMIEGERALRRFVEHRLAARRPALDPTERRTVACVLSAGFLSLLRDWLEQGRRVSAAEIERRYAAAENRIVA